MCVVSIVHFGTAFCILNKGALSQHWLGMFLLSIINRSIVFLYSSHVCVESDGHCKCKDVMKDPAHYETAWQLSKKRFARAQRSLGRRIGWKENIAKRLPVIHIIGNTVTTSLHAVIPAYSRTNHWLASSLQWQTFAYHASPSLPFLSSGTTMTRSRLPKALKHSNWP